jgi:hypothetical protein
MARVNLSSEATPKTKTKTPHQNATKSTTKSTPKSLKGFKRKRSVLDLASSEFPGFGLSPMKPNKKAKALESVKKASASEVPINELLSADIYQKNPFEDTTLEGTYHTVSPAYEWESLCKRYSQFLGMWAGQSLKYGQLMCGSQGE